MPLRFVVLDHHGPKGDHWDLMLENGGTLTTWAIPPQTRSGPFTCCAVPLPDHRLAYLEYEGPISDNRGTVRQVDHGTYEARESGLFHLSGSRFTGELFVENMPDNRVMVRFVPESDPGENVSIPQ